MIINSPSYIIFRNNVITLILTLTIIKFIYISIEYSGAQIHPPWPVATPFESTAVHPSNKLLSTLVENVVLTANR